MMTGMVAEAAIIAVEIIVVMAVIAVEITVVMAVIADRDAASLDRQPGGPDGAAFTETVSFPG